MDGHLGWDAGGLGVAAADRLSNGSKDGSVAVVAVQCAGDGVFVGYRLAASYHTAVGHQIAAMVDGGDYFNDRGGVAYSDDGLVGADPVG